VDEGRLGVLAHEHGDVARADAARAGRLARRRALLELRVRRHHPHDVGGDVIGYVLACALRRRLALLRDQHRGVGALDDPDAQRGVRRCAVQSAVAMRGDRLDGPVEDLVVAKAGPAEHGVQRGDEVLIAPPVGGQCLLVARDARGCEVGVDVGATEGVHRLLGVADEHEGALRRTAVLDVLGKCAADDVPLDRVGVLELVDERDPVALAQFGDGERAGRGIGERGVEAREEVVEREDPEQPLAPFELVARDVGQSRPHCRPPVARRIYREDRGFGVGDGGAGDLVGLTPGEGRLVLGTEPADVEVVDDVLEQVERVLHDVATVLHVADDPQTAERLEAEAVGGRDGGGVEVGERMGEPFAADAYLVGRAGGRSCTTSSAGTGWPSSTRVSPSSASRSRSRTRSRNSPVARRVKVTRRISCNGMPDVT
jgi:hypothetical protein